MDYKLPEYSQKSENFPDNSINCLLTVKNHQLITKKTNLSDELFAVVEESRVEGKKISKNVVFFVFFAVLRNVANYLQLGF
jgi:hypothetical protein